MVLLNGAIKRCYQTVLLIGVIKRCYETVSLNGVIKRCYEMVLLNGAIKRCWCTHPEYITDSFRRQVTGVFDPHSTTKVASGQYTSYQIRSKSACLAVLNIRHSMMEEEWERVKFNGPTC